jgi:hypothetical protein
VQRTDCLTEWYVSAAPFTSTGSHTRVFCKPGASCDADGDANDAVCTFRVALCLNSTDPYLQCAPGAIDRFKLQRPNLLKPRPRSFDFENATAIMQALSVSPARGVAQGTDSRTAWFRPPITATNVCTDLFDVMVPLKARANGTFTKGTLTLRAQATTLPSAGQRSATDSDSLVLVCYSE